MFEIKIMRTGFCGYFRTVDHRRLVLQTRWAASSASVEAGIDSRSGKIIRKWLPLVPVWIFCIISGVVTWIITANGLQSWKLWLGLTGFAIIITMTVIITVLYSRKKDTR